MQTPDHGHWKDDYSEVGCDVNGGVRKPHGELVDTACALLCPEGLYWYTSKDTAKDRPDGVADDYGKDAPARDLEFSCREHSVVLQQDRALRQAK